MPSDSVSAHQVDMLNGPLLGKIIKFAIPFAASSILQQLFNSVDVAVVGRFASSEALAAVGANTFLINLMINLFVGISIGTNVIIANHIGQRDDKGVSNAIATTGVIALTSGGILLIVGQLIAPLVLQAMGTPANILSDAIVYLRIFLLGSPFFMIYNFGASILRSKGDTKRPLYILLIAGVINTILNLVFVINFHLGVAGVAIATDIANAFSATSVVILLRRERMPFRLDVKRIHVVPRELKRILQIGLPAGLQSMVFSFSNIFVQTGINTFGSAAVAGASVAQTFDSYCYFLMVAFCGAAVTFIGQNYGAGKIDRCKKIFKICLIFGALSCWLANMTFLLGQDFFMSIFTKDPDVIHYGEARMCIVLVFQALAAGYEIPASAMRGLGHSLEPALLTVLGTCVFRLVWIFFVMPVFPGYEQLMWVYPISWLLTTLLVFTAYLRISRKAFALHCHDKSAE